MIKILMRIGAELKTLLVPTGEFFLGCWMLVLLLAPLMDYSFVFAGGKYVYAGMWALCVFAVCGMLFIRGSGKHPLLLRAMWLGGFLLLQAMLLYIVRNFAVENM